MKRSITLVLSLALLLACLCVPVSAEGGYDNFQSVAVYTDGLFDDVKPEDWFARNVAAAYELGLMVGTGGGFDPQGAVTLAQSVTLAARIHSIYHNGTADFEPTEPWYQVYLDYCAAQGIVSRENVADPEAPATRSQFAAILAHALPESALPAINSVEENELPDVRSTDANAAEIYRLYRAGILTGSDEFGTFEPAAEIQRAAVAAIVTRMAYRSLRMKYTLAKPSYPDLQEKPRAGEDFFTNSAMLGNSLAQGMKLYSGLNMNYFVYQSTTVFDPNGYSPDRCFDLMLQGNYDRVYIEYGINEIHMGPEKITEGYSALIDRIRAKMPRAEIYVMAVTPVTKTVSDRGSFAMTKIRALNAALRQMCGEKSCWYLDCCEALCDETGYLPEAYAGWDGSPHLSVSAYKYWAELIRTHY